MHAKINVYVHLYIHLYIYLYNIGKAHNNGEINEYGNNMIRLIKSNIINTTVPHGVYIDSCTHHCTSCSGKYIYVYIYIYIYRYVHM
jgi:hypothetical protein